MRLWHGSGTHNQKYARPNTIKPSRTKENSLYIKIIQLLADITTKRPAARIEGIFLIDPLLVGRRDPNPELLLIDYDKYFGCEPRIVEPFEPQLGPQAPTMCNLRIIAADDAMGFAYFSRRPWHFGHGGAPAREPT